MSRKDKPKLRGLRKLANERDVKRAAMQTYNLIARGEITPAQGSAMNGSLQVARAAIGTEVDREVLERLERLEAETPGLDRPEPTATVTPLSLVKRNAS